MQRFFLSEEAFHGEVVYFPEDISHQITRVLRLKIGDEVVTIDPLGKEYMVVLTDVNPKICVAQVQEITTAAGEPKTQLDLYIALTQREKFEWVLQKCTEVGVASITPVVTERCLISKQDQADKKRDRWERIIKEAAEQSRRGKVPFLKETQSFEQVCGTVRAGQRLIAWEGNDGNSLANLLGESAVHQVALLIGPEGGFSPDEIRQARASGWDAFTMGKRILRMETAAVVASALILYQLNDMGD